MPAIPQTRLIDDLRGVAERGELTAHYQPQVDLATGRVVGVEALVRWQHPEFGTIAPSDLIPAAEAAGLIGEIGHHVLELAVQQVAIWQQIGLRLDLSVNVSPNQLSQHEYCENVGTVLQRWQVEPSVLTLEITETEPIHDLSSVVECLQHVRDLGVGVSVDDFGAGYSSIDQLRSLPANELKIDQSIIRGPADQATGLLADVLDEAKSRGLRIVAEGVETTEQLELAKQLGCDRAQGYLLGRPMDANDLVRSLT